MANSRKSPIAEPSRTRRRAAPPDAGTALPEALEAHVENVLAHAVPGVGARVCMALSGGLDSMALLEIVHRLRSRRAIELSALHVHHGLSPNAGQWADFCRKACESRGIAFELRQIDVRATRGASLEQRARDLRYACFAAVGADVLMLAHHLDDQCETFLLRLLRGSGLHGLLGMPATRSLNRVTGISRAMGQSRSVRTAGLAAARTLDGCVTEALQDVVTPSPADGVAPMIDAGALAVGDSPAARPTRDVLLLRPLLDVTRARLREYAIGRGLRWIDDDSNDDTALTRNYVRAEVLPRIEARFPAYRDAIARALASLTDAAAIVDRQARVDLAAATTPCGLRVSVLAALGTGRALNVLRAYLARQGCLAPSRARLQEAWRQLRDAGPGAQLGVTVGQGELRRYRDAIHWVLSAAALERAAPRLWMGEACLSLPSGQGELRFYAARGAGIRAACMSPSRVAVVRALGSMRLKPDAARPSRTLKNLFQEHAVPPWIRQVTPVLRAGADTLWVGGLGYDCRHLAGPDEAGFRVEWISEPSG